LLDALKRHQSETAAELDALMPAVLGKAFRGGLLKRSLKLCSASGIFA
jgi:hypothetical protein